MERQKEERGGGREREREKERETERFRISLSLPLSGIENFADVFTLNEDNAKYFFLLRTFEKLKETLLALVRDLFTFSSKVIKRFIIV
jgi:hypothetical protein